jgi:hypothetical protein
MSDESNLKAALAAWRDAGPEEEKLSVSSRSELFRRVQSAGSAPFVTATLFPPVRRWALAAGIPLVLVAGLAWLGGGVGDPAPPGVRIEAAKQGEEVVFTIADGRRVHQVRKSENPSEFDSAAAVRVRNGGSYRDGVDKGADLVFYRID